MFTREISNRMATDFKFAFNEALAHADETQESLAAKVGASQAQVNNWCNPNSDRNFPMALMPVLPSRMQQALFQFLNVQMSTAQKFNNLNGSIDDELLRMFVLEADLKRESERDPKKAKKLIGQIREMLDRADQELTVGAEKRT